MSDQFLVPMLIPERVGGGQTRAYQLTADSVHPTRNAGVDDYGQIVEETIPINKWREFVHPSGCFNKVTLRTAPGNHADDDARQIEQRTLLRVIMSGFLPVDECPFTNEYKAWKGGPLVKPKAGESDCGGKPGGCEHLHAVAAKRRERSIALNEQEVARLSKMKDDEATRQALIIAKALKGDGAMDLAAARERGRKGKAEE